jgi:hypothetical protein
MSQSSGVSTRDGGGFGGRKSGPSGSGLGVMRKCGGGAEDSIACPGSFFLSPLPGKAKRAREASGLGLGHRGHYPNRPYQKGKCNLVGRLPIVSKPSPAQLSPSYPNARRQTCFVRGRRREERTRDIPTSHRDAAVGPDSLSPSHGHPRPSHQVLSVSPLPLPGRASRQSRRRQGLLLLIRRFVLRLADGGVRQEDGG